MNAGQRNCQSAGAGSGTAIGAGTQIVAIFGDPVEHSLSPAMHNAAYAALGLDHVYVAFHVKPSNFGAALRAVSALGILGVNLTIPHKEAAARVLKRLSAEARLLRAVNCVVNRRGELYGDNTDARGLERALREVGARVRGRLVIVIGAGGAAASALLALTRLGAREIVLANRTPARAVMMARRFTRAAAGRSALEACSLRALVDAALLKHAALILNATPMGLTTPSFAELDYAATTPGCLFYDLIYAREPTPFLKPAAALGRPYADGAGMLVGQGEIAFRLINGIAPPPGVMRRTLLERLGRG